MTYKQALHYLFEQLPMFHRIGAAAYKANLDNTILLCRLLENPEQKFPSIHIAGTNGKGSTSHFLASILQEAGYKTGLFTSPHLKDFRERIKINGKPIPKSEVIKFIIQNKKKFNSIQPSFFEWTFALASNYFAEQKVEIAIIETGMGGRLDSTNVVKPILCCITNIDFDHTQFLGTTLHAIATEKAGIIKPGIPIIIGESNEETAKVFVDFAKKFKSDLIFADKEYNILSSEIISAKTPLLKVNYQASSRRKIILKSPLTGTYQLKNLRNVLSITSRIGTLGFPVSESQIAKGIKNVTKNTALLGRWQVLQTKPLCVADIGHNPAGIQEILIQLSRTPHNFLHFVIGVVNDKDIDTMLSLLPKKAIYYFCKADIPRGLDANKLKELASIHGLLGESFSSVRVAYEKARHHAKQNDMVLVGGSAFVVAEIV